MLLVIPTRACSGRAGEALLLVGVDYPNLEAESGVGLAKNATQASGLYGPLNELMLLSSGLV